MGWFVNGLIEEMIDGIADAMDDDTVSKNHIEKSLDTILMLIEIDDPNKHMELVNSPQYWEGRKEILSHFN